MQLRIWIRSETREFNARRKRDDKNCISQKHHSSFLLSSCGLATLRLCVKVVHLQVHPAKRQSIRNINNGTRRNPGRYRFLPYVLCALRSAIVQNSSFLHKFLSGNFRKLGHISFSSRQQCCNGGSSFVCQHIAVSAGDFLNQSVSA